LRSRGIQPDIIVCRSDQPISDGLKRKISLLCDVPINAVISAVDEASIYDIPITLHHEGLDTIVCNTLNIDLEEHPIDLGPWESVVRRVHNTTRTLRVGIIGKYVTMPDAYLSVGESIRHAGFGVGARTIIEYHEAERVPSELDADRLSQLDAHHCARGFGERGIEGMIATARIARENDIPYLGICLGMQVQVIEFARHVLGLSDAQSTEFSHSSSAPVISLLAEQIDVTDLGGTMRLGAWPAMLREARSSPNSTVRLSSLNATDTVTSSTLAIATSLRPLVFTARETRLTGGWLSSSNFPVTRSSWALRLTPSSNRVPIDHTPSFSD